MDEIEEFYEAIRYFDIEKISTLLEAGVSPNVLRAYSPSNGFRNGAMELLEIGWLNESLDIVDILIDKGLDVNHQDDEGHSILMYVIDFLKYSSEIKTFEKERLHNTFDKIMYQQPLKVSNMFDFAFDLNVLSWFEPYLDRMVEADREVYDSYRLARLFEK